jgi:hypothetical protein
MAWLLAFLLAAITLLTTPSSPAFLWTFVGRVFVICLLVPPAIACTICFAGRAFFDLDFRRKQRVRLAVLPAAAFYLGLIFLLPSLIWIVVSGE